MSPIPVILPALAKEDGGDLVKKYLACLALALAARPTFAQSAGSFMTGVEPRNITLKKIDISSHNRPIPVNTLTGTQPKTGMIDMGNNFPRLTLGSWPPKMPSMSILKGKSNPFQPNPIVGKNPFDPPPTKKK